MLQYVTSALSAWLWNRHNCILFTIRSKYYLQSSKLLQALDSTVVHGIVPRREPWPFFCSFQTFTCFEMGSRSFYNFKPKHGLLGRGGGQNNPTAWYFNIVNGSSAESEQCSLSWVYINTFVNSSYILKFFSHCREAPWKFLFSG
jgi:hypothetical protein